MEGSLGVLVAFANVTVPASETATMSVKVPPTSIPILHLSSITEHLTLCLTNVKYSHYFSIYLTQSHFLVQNRISLLFISVVPFSSLFRYKS